MPLTPSADEIAALRERYRGERERRVRSDGTRQYRRAEDAFAARATDPWTPEVPGREPLRDAVDVAVVGGGFGGVLAGARLRQRGLERIRIVDEGGDFGGTWYWNRYPGVHCDVEAHVYLPMLDETGYVPRWKYAPGDEIRRHAMRIADRFGLYTDALFATRVTSLAWDEGTQTWAVVTDRGDAFRATYVVTATGTLSDPKLPALPGVEEFGGRVFHTSRWDYAYTGGGPDGGLTGLAGKTVGIVGTGATAVQAIPPLAEYAGRLLVFQRTPSAVDVRGNRRTEPADVGAHRTGWARERRDNFLRVVSGEDTGGVDLVADGWTDAAALLEKLLPSYRRDHLPDGDRETFERAYETADAARMNALRARVEAAVTDPETAGLLLPWYRYACKRPTFSDDYYAAFNRDNVTLVDTAPSQGIERVTEQGVVVAGTLHRLDCLIFATGFSVGASGVLSGRLPVRGRGGVRLLEVWRNGPRTLHGFTSNGFPNLVQMGHVHNASSVNFTHVLDEQAVHAAALIAAAEAGGAFVEPSREAEDDWIATLAGESPGHEWFHAECTPGYYNREGRGRPDGHGYPHSAPAFHALLGRWREASIGEILHARAVPAGAVRGD
ncbi:NAD(P)/FAD-dependent oxidoreductase [Streptomyces sp. NPDC048290]|uniref:flavin-containing monooxygenase n=1 Tax=Streptomyces sp. NPDC048290 TaxID=3155811 RepID=UPI0034172C29